MKAYRQIIFKRKKGEKITNHILNITEWNKKLKAMARETTKTKIKNKYKSCHKARAIMIINYFKLQGKKPGPPAFILESIITQEKWGNVIAAMAMHY